MAKQIRKSDIVEEDIFRGIRESADKTIQVISKINEEFKMTAITLKESIGGAKFDSSKSINEFNKSVEKTNQITKQTIKNEQELQKARELRAKADERLEKLAQSKLKTEEQSIKTAETHAKAEQRKAKEMEKSAKAAENEANAYKQLEKNTRELKNESKRLAAEMLKLEQAGEKNTKEFRQLSREYKAVTTAAQQGDAQLKKIDSTVGDNFRNVGNYTGAINKLKNGLGQLGLAFGIGTVVSNAGRTIVEFDQKVADLIAITGASGDDLKFFKEQAIELGKSVQGGAGEVIEAYKLIGSAKPELLQNAQALDAVTQSAITLSQASGMTLPEAATALTDAMNQFGAPAEQAGKFIDTLANGALFGAAEIPQVTEALLKFGAVANTANVSLEESTALIEALAEKGVKGAEAGTALRNVMLKLSAPDALPKEAQERLKGLGVSMEALKDTSKPFSERLKALKPLLSDNAAMVKVFGTENAVAATNLIKNTDRIKELTGQMHTQGTASLQAENRTKTLSFAFNELKESWNALVLELSSGEGTSKILVDGLSFIARNLGTIVEYLGKALLAWGAYRTALAAVQAKQFLFNGGLKDTISGMMQAVTGTKKLATGAMEAGDNIGKAGKAMSAVPWIAIIGLVIELATALYDVASGAKAAREQQELTAQANARAEKNVNKLTQATKNHVDEQKRLLDIEIRKRKAAGENAKKLDEEQIKRNKEIEQQGLKRLEYQEKIRKEQFTKIAPLIEKIAKLEADVNSPLIKLEQARNELINALPKSYRAAALSGEELLKKGSGFVQQITEEIVQLSSAQKEYTNLIDESNTKLVENNVQHEDNTGKINAKIPKQRELNTELKATNEYLSKQTELLNQLDQLEKEKEIRKVQTDIDTELANLTKQARETGFAEVDIIEEMVAKKYELEKEAILMRKQFHIQQLEETYRIDAEKAIQALNDERDKLLAQEGLTAEARKQIEANYQREKAKIDMDNLQRQADLELEKRILAEETNVELIDLEKTKQDEINQINDQIIDGQIEYSSQQVKISEQTTEKIVKNFETQKELVRLAADYFIEQSEKKIAQLEKEISAAENQYKVYEQLAINGNITAKESLAEQQRIIVEANKRKEQEQRRIERIKLAEAAYNGYISNVEKGEKNPLVKTITDLTLLRQFVSSLPTFYEGTETTVGEALGAPQMKGRDGYIVRVDGDEKILNPGLSKMTGGLSTQEIASISQDYLTGKLIRAGETPVHFAPTFAGYEVLSKLDELKSAFENMPQSSYELGPVTQEAFSVIHKMQRGNQIIYNKYRVKK